MVTENATVAPGGMVFRCCPTANLKWTFGTGTPQLCCASCGSMWGPDHPEDGRVMEACPNPEFHQTGNNGIINTTGWGCCSAPELEWIHSEGEITTIKCHHCDVEFGSPACEEPRDHNEQEYRDKIYEVAREYQENDDLFKQAVDARVRDMQSTGVISVGGGEATPDTCTHYQAAWDRFDKLLEEKTTWGRTILQKMMKDCLIHPNGSNDA